MIRVLAWVAAFLGPAVFAGLTYWVLGATVTGAAIGGGLAGVLGLSGAAMYWATQVLIVRYRAVQEIEIGKLAAGVLQAQVTLGGRERIVVDQDEGLRFYPADPNAVWSCCEAGARVHPQPCPWHSHEGLARMHSDIAADAQRRHLEQDYDDRS